MKIFQVVLTVSAFTLVSATSRGEAYNTERLCRGLNERGKSSFKAVVTVQYSQKFANATFEEVDAIADFTLKLSEKCCSTDASPDCYEKGTQELATLSCRKDSPFPKHPDLVKCCGKDGDEWRSCFASLHYSSEEPPSLQELTDEDICEQLKHDAKVFSARFSYEFSRRHQTIPADMVLKATKNYVEMAEKCCSPSASKICFLQERLQHKDFNIFLRYASNVCQNARYLKSHKTALMVYYASLLKLPFEDALTMTQSIHENLAKCCSEESPQCLTEKFTELHKALCNDSSPGVKSEDFQKCCGRAPLDSLPCMDKLERHAQLFPNKEQFSLFDFCGTAQSEALERFWFETGAKYPSVPVSVFASFLDIIKLISEPCCNASDAKACMKINITDFTTFFRKIDDFCAKYSKLDFTEFKKVILKEIQSKDPEVSKDHAETIAQTFTDFSLSCCSRYAPARTCKRMVEEMTICRKDDCAA